jgi:hypothetical protein
MQIFLGSRDPYMKDEKSGGYNPSTLPIEGSLPGTGACTKCGNIFSTIQWPEDAFFSVSVPGGRVWAWNTTYLLALRARVAGDRVLERQLALANGRLLYFLARIPKQAVLKRNRACLMRTVDAWLRLPTEAP